MGVIKTDCFAYRGDTKNGGCAALNFLYCSAGKCLFYKKKGHECDGCPNKGIHRQECTECRAARLIINNNRTGGVPHA